MPDTIYNKVYQDTNALSLLLKICHLGKFQTMYSTFSNNVLKLNDRVRPNEIHIHD